MINISNVINVSVATPPAGILPYAINNLACFTKDTPTGSIDVYASYTSPTEVAADWGTDSNVYAASVAIFGQSPNILSGGGVFVVIPMVAQETLATAITRTKDLVYYGGFAETWGADASETLAAAAVAQTARKLYFVASSTSSDLDGADGLLFKIQDQNLTQTRGLYYSNGTDLATFKWAYAGRAMSTNFSGTNTTQTMHLKQLSGVSSDNISQTILNKAKAVGADVYVSIAGTSCVFSTGANEFFDNIYNLNWFIGAIEVAGFNFLRTTSSKIPQTESGMDGLKGAYRTVCVQAQANRFVAPGIWTSADTFGNPDDFRRNIQDYGYYIYSLPVNQQLVADRAARKAPVAQVAIKAAGAIHSSDVIIYLNA